MDYFLRIALIAGLLCMLLPATVASQSGGANYDRRLDLGYEVKGYGYSYTTNPEYPGSHYILRKGFLTASFREYPGDHVFFTLDAGYLLNNDRTVVHGGPLNFNRASLGTNFGLHFDKVSVYVGVAGGVSWNYRIRAETRDQPADWIAAATTENNLDGTLRAGLTYHLTPHLSLKGEISKSYYDREQIRPAAAPDARPAFHSITLSDYAASVGVQFGIPWNSKERPVSRPDRPSTQNPPPAAIPTRTGESNASGSGSGDRADRSDSDAPDFTAPLWIRQTITSGYGDGRGHEGWDFDLNAGDTVRTVAPGTVTRTTRSGAYGIMVEVTHSGGFASRYAHLSDILVQEGTEVGRAHPIGLGGRSGRTTGTHLHFELLKDGYPVNPGRYLERD